MTLGEAQVVNVHSRRLKCTWGIWGRSDEYCCTDAAEYINLCVFPASTRDFMLIGSVDDDMPIINFRW